MKNRGPLQAYFIKSSLHRNNVIILKRDLYDEIKEGSYNGEHLQIIYTNTHKIYNTQHLSPFKCSLCIEFDDCWAVGSWPDISVCPVMMTQSVRKRYGCNGTIIRMCSCFWHVSRSTLAPFQSMISTIIYCYIFSCKNSHVQFQPWCRPVPGIKVYQYFIKLLFQNHQKFSLYGSCSLRSFKWHAGVGGMWLKISLTVWRLEKTDCLQKSQTVMLCK